ncbi:hypothetical protein NGM36_24825 [Streptomyces mutabilis]|uniref:hypothetical protein n=1 Tax=Streptomyces mutabilis TaxID=67332 RepID=UPI0022BA593B|nr:hypothetical protein [Streptomyces mutabilis]MCZ9352954.1 hypothetical protein [Streptomyces mutabilis]
MAIYSVVIAVTLISGDGDAPWLVESDFGPALLVMGPAGVVGFLGGYAHAALRNRWGLNLQDRKDLRQPLPRPVTPAYLLGVKWLVTGWRLWLVGLACVILAAPFAAGMSLSDIEERSASGDGGMFWQVFLAGASGSVWAVWALTLKGRELRRGKERIKVADEYLAIREERLHQEFDAMTEKFLQEQQEWRAQAMADLYEQILDQQARGLLPCPTCDERPNRS